MDEDIIDKWEGNPYLLSKVEPDHSNCSPNPTEGFKCLSQKSEFLRTNQNSPSKGNIIKRILNSFKYSDDIDPHTGEVKLKAELNGFSLQMIAIGGSIGTGLLIGSGKSLNEGGAVPLISGYLFVATFIYCMTQSLGELSVAMPMTGSFTKYAAKFIDESWGFAMGWNYCLQWLILLPMELVASTMTLSYWSQISKMLPDYAIIIIVYSAIIMMNILSVKYYGAFEIFFSSIKVVAILIFLISGSIEVMGWGGNPKIGFKYWKEPGVIGNKGFYGISNLIVTAAFSFSGSELVGITASESRNPEKEVPKALKQVFWRICAFYILSLFLVSLLVPYNHPKLVGDTKIDISASPFVLALSNYNNNIFSHFMNSIILVSILSVGNSAIYASSRTLVALAQNKHAPSCFGFIDRMKRPNIAILTSISFGLLAFVSCVSAHGAEQMFLWLMAISGTSVTLTYGTIAMCHIRFRSVLKYNGINIKEELPYLAQSGLGGSYYAVIISGIIIIFQVYSSILKEGIRFSLNYFLEKVIGILVVLMFYITHKLYFFYKHKRLEFVIPIKNIDINFGRFANQKERMENIENIRIDRLELQSKPWHIRTYSFWC